MEDGEPRTFRIRGSNGMGWGVVWAALAIAVPVGYLTQDTTGSLPEDVRQYRIIAAAGFGLFGAFAVLAVFFFNRRKEIQVRPDALAIVSHSGREEVYSLEDMSYVACECFEARTAGSLVWRDTKLILQLHDKHGKEVLRYYDDHFSKSNVEALRQAIKAARPTLQVTNNAIV